MAAAVDSSAPRRLGEKICVHGDYDVDGICATALAVLTLRELGADVSWHLPSRFEEGYGVSEATIERLASEGVRLLLTVDCGITAAPEVEAARRLGIDMIVSDHHRPGESSPRARSSPPGRRTTRSSASSSSERSNAMYSKAIF